MNLAGIPPEPFAARRALLRMRAYRAFRLEVQTVRKLVTSIANGKVMI